MFRNPHHYTICKEDEMLILCVHKKEFKNKDAIPAQFEKINDNTYRLRLTDLRSEDMAIDFTNALSHLKHGNHIFNECVEQLEPDYRPRMA
jgi:hypothetical protein